MKSKYNKQVIKLIGKNIRELRKKQKLSQAQLAFESDMPREQICRIESGKINTTIGNLFKIAEVLNIPVKDIFDFEEKK